MHTKIIWIALALIIAIALAWFALSPKPATAPLDTDAPVASEEGAPAASDGAVIIYTGAGFSPEVLTVRAGDTVRFENRSDSGGMWVGADDHPTHTEFDGTSTREHCVDGETIGGSFDSCRALRPGETYEFTFERAGTYGYHNHTRAAYTGTIVVE